GADFRTGPLSSARASGACIGCAVRPLQSFAERDAYDPGLLPVHQIDVELRCNLPVADLEAIFPAHPQQRLAALFAVLDAGTDIELPCSGVVGERNREYPRIDVAERVLQ